jgi:oxygen-dependent protoporphyrinogen oxidase
VLLRLYIGRFGQDATALSDDALLALAQSELKQAMGITAPPLFHRLHRWPLAMPQYTLGHLERIATIEREAASQPGLYLAGNYFRGVGIPDCISSGDAAAHAAALFPKMSAIQSE